MHVVDTYSLISYIHEKVYAHRGYLRNNIIPKRENFKHQPVSSLSKALIVPPCYLCYQPVALVISLCHTAPSLPILSCHSIYYIVAFLPYLSCCFVSLPILNCCVPSSPFHTGLFCTVSFQTFPSLPISYHDISIHSVPFYPNLIHRLQ